MPAMAPYRPNTFPRSDGGNVTWMMARICGTISPAIAPWTNRAPISIAGFAAAPHSSEASVNPAIPTRKIRRRP
jgi:hypothetical protein